MSHGFGGRLGVLDEAATKGEESDGARSEEQQRCTRLGNGGHVHRDHPGTPKGGIVIVKGDVEWTRSIIEEKDVIQATGGAGRAFIPGAEAEKLVSPRLQRPFEVDPDTSRRKGKVAGPGS